MDSAEVTASASSTDGIYEVEEIIGYRCARNGKWEEFLVKWAGYDEITWEKPDNLKTCSRILDNFKKRFIKRCGFEISPERFQDPEASESDDSDLEFSSEDDSEERRMERIYPDVKNCGIAKGWKPEEILGADFKSEKKTYLIKYKHKRQVEHLPVKFVYSEYPDLVEDFHRKTGQLHPWKKKRYTIHKA